MHNLVLSPIDPEKLISSISDRVTANILKELQNYKIESTLVFTPKFKKTPSLSKQALYKQVQSDYEKLLKESNEELLSQK